MAIKIKNELGNIIINENVISLIAGNAIHSLPGIANSTMGAAFWTRENIGKGIKVMSENNVIIIDVSIVIEFGVKISQIAESIMEAVKQQVKEFSGFDVERVNVLIEGLKIDK